MKKVEAPPSRRSVWGSARMGLGHWFFKIPQCHQGAVKL